MGKGGLDGTGKALSAAGARALAEKMLPEGGNTEGQEVSSPLSTPSSREKRRQRDAGGQQAGASLP